MSPRGRWQVAPGQMSHGRPEQVIAGGGRDTPGLASRACRPAPVRGSDADQRRRPDAPEPNRPTAPSTARSASRHPYSRAPSVQLPVASAGRGEALDPDADQPDPGPVQLERVVERAGGGVDLVAGVGRRGQRPGPGDRAEVGEPHLDADGPADAARTRAAGPRSSRPAAAAPGARPRGRRRRGRRSPRRRSSGPAPPARPAAGRAPWPARAGGPRRPRRGPGAAPAAARAARSPTVRRPSPASCSAVRSPTPHSAPTGSGCRNRATPSAGTTSSPSGLQRDEASLATNFVGATPTEQVMPCSSAIRARIRSPIRPAGRAGAGRRTRRGTPRPATAARPAG